MTKENCSECGAEILPSTAEDRGGKCVPCSEGRGRPRPLPGSDVEPGRRADWMGVGARKDREDRDHVDYWYFIDIWDKDPRFRQRYLKVATAIGLLRIDKRSRSVEVLVPVNEDHDNRSASRIAVKILQSCDGDDYPETASWQCG